MRRAIALATLLAACSTGGVETFPPTGEVPSSSAAPTPSPSGEPATSASASVEDSGPPSPSASPQANLMAGPATVAVNQLRVRTEPGLSAPVVTFPYADNNVLVNAQLEVSEGMPVWLLDEAPIKRDGLEWRKVAVNNVLHNDGSILTGWVAQAGADGSAWLAPFAYDCPVIRDGTVDQPAMDPLRWMSILGPACFGDDSLTFAAYWPELPEGGGLGGLCVDLEPAWLVCTNIHYAHVNVTGDTSWAFPVHAPDVYEKLGERGQWFMLTGHFDDPAARDCNRSQLFDTSAEAAEMFCRTRFVLESAQSITGRATPPELAGKIGASGSRWLRLRPAGLSAAVRPQSAA